MPLAYAIEKLNASTNTQTQDLTDRNSDLSIQFQLLQRQKQNSEAIIYSIRDIVLVTDSFDRIIMASAAASQFFGFKIEDANLKPIEAFVSDENFVEIMTRARTNELAHVKHEVTFADDPKQRTFDCIISCVKDDKEIISGVVAVLHDVTKEKEISKTKNDFVSHVSHELKTPLSSINAYAEMLVDGEAEDAETIKQFSTIIQTQAQRLNRLIEDILNISRIESGLTKITKKPISLAMLVRDAVEMITSYAAEKNINIVEPHSIVCDQVYADKDMITQVIINLLSNAVKYTEQGGTVTINLDVNDADQFVKVSVSDTGVGIPAEDVEHVFDKFFRVDANKKYAKGTGLGLNLVKQIVEKTHEGAVFVTSQQGKGSTFAFTLPLESARVLQKV
jgi:two-component system phosphate regulon sensor histidine kinase PhoR